MDYLETRYPEPPLYPEAPEERAFVQQLALVVACDIHPLNNLRVLKYIKHTLKLDDDAKNEWIHHWIKNGFTALETLLNGRNWQGPYCHGEQVTIADASLIPQIYNARRFEIVMDDFPTLVRIEQACMELDAFRRAAPENQIDANT